MPSALPQAMTGKVYVINTLLRVITPSLLLPFVELQACTQSEENPTNMKEGRRSQHNIQKDIEKMLLYLVAVRAAERLDMTGV